MPRISKPQPLVATPRTSATTVATVGTSSSLPKTGRSWSPPVRQVVPIRGQLEASRVSAATARRLAKDEPLASYGLAGLRKTKSGPEIEISGGSYRLLTRLNVTAKGVTLTPLTEPPPIIPNPPPGRPTLPYPAAPARALTPDEAKAVYVVLHKTAATIRSGTALQQLRGDLPIIENMLKKLSW